MNKPSSYMRLKELIMLQEIKQHEAEERFREQATLTIEQLHPVKLIKQAVKEFSVSPELQEELIKTTFSVAIGYLGKKIAFGNSSNPVKQVLGTLFQIGVTSLVSKKSDQISTFLGKLISKFKDNLN